METLSDIFLSYARTDFEQAKRIRGALASLGWSVWWDPELCAGEVWDEQLEKEITAARSILVLWSSGSVQRYWVKKEAAVGLERGCLISVMLQATIELPLQFRHVQTDSLALWDGAVDHASQEKGNLRPQNGGEI